MMISMQKNPISTVFTFLQFFGQKYPKPAIVCGRTCVVCDQLKNARTHAHRTHVLEVFSHAHVRPHIARLRARTHLRNPCLADFGPVLLP